MDCPECGSANDASSRFCNDCGSPLAAVCPSCAATNRPGSRFCGSCGSSMTAASAASSQPTAPGAQRRVVSVLFADLVGFTTISQHRDAEEVRDLLTRYFDASRAAVERHGGIVEKFIGDAVMAVWGTEVAHEDDAERAVRAGLELVDAVAGLGSDLGIDLQARAGVLTGETAVTLGATDQGMVAGDIVNTASRLQTTAEPGTVLVGEPTFHAAADAISFDARGEVSVKGRDEPVRTWQALRIIAERGGGGRPGRPEPPFVGRAEELRLVRELLHVTARERRARLVSITGIGGIGKSRLVWEFRKYVDGLSDDVFWHQGRCPAYGEGITFWALGEMVRMRAGIAEADQPVEARRKLDAMLDRYLADDVERRWVEPRMAHLLGLDQAPPGTREELFSAWRTLFERTAELGVTAMVFEDLHWADPGLLDFIDSLLEWARSSAIMVVTLARPELLDRRPTWGAGQRNYTALHLEPLADEPMTALVSEFVTGLTNDDTSRIVTRSEGVPLYAVETIRMLADRGVLAVDNAGYRLVGDIGTLEVPGSLHALIAARLDVLPADERELLRDAAVLGTSFTLEGLATVTGEEAPTVEQRLRDLVRKEFLTLDTDPRSPERGQYGFLQGLIREVAYGTLSKADRRLKHTAVAKHFESLQDDELVGLVATHYVEAMRATPEGPDADGLGAQVRAQVERAAKRALSLGSPDQALAYVEQAIDLSPEQERMPLLELAGEAAFRAGRHEQSVRYFDEAADLARAAADSAALVRVATAVALPLELLDRRVEEMRRLEEALEQLPADADDHLSAKLFSRLASSEQMAGRQEQALAYVERALPAAERCGSLDVLAEAVSERSVILFALGRHREALILAHGAVDLAGETGSHLARALALTNLGVQLVETGPRASYDAGLDAAEAAHRAGAQSLEQLSLINALEAAIDSGLFDEAEQLIDDLMPRIEDDFHRSGLAFSQATLAAYRGDAAQAATHLADVESRRSGLEGRIIHEHTWQMRVTSLVKLLAGEVVEAYDLGMQSVTLDPTGMNAPSTLNGCAHAAAWLRDGDKLRETVTALRRLPGQWLERVREQTEAALAAVDGQVETAAVQFRRVLDQWIQEDLPLDHAWCVIDALAVLPRELVSDDDVEMARAELTRIGATPLLARLDA